MSETVPPRRRRVTAADGTGLAVVEVGAADAPAIVLAHGVGSSARFVLAAFTAPVLQAGHRLVTFDQRGHGSSAPVRDTAGHRLDDYAADLAAVVAATAGDRPPIVGGVSLGGHAAVRAVARGQLDVAAVIACLPAWTGSAARGVGPHAAIAAEVREIGIAGITARLRTATGMPDWLRDTLLTDYPRHDADSLAAALLALDGGEAPGRVEVADLDAPLGVVAWPHDPGHPLEVARAWADAADGALVTLRLSDLDAGVDRLGAAALRAARAASGSAPLLGQHRLGDP